MYGNARVSHSCALKDLRKLGYEVIGSETAHGCPYQLVATDNGRKAVKIHARSYVAAHRYPQGISSQLLRVVDEFIFWFERERWCYIIPSAWLLDLSYHCKLVKNGEQWLCNLRACDHVLEVIGNSSIDIGPFKVAIPAH
jgi:hypothetical protein